MLRVSIGMRRWRGTGQGELLMDEMLRLVERVLCANDMLVTSSGADPSISDSLLSSCVDMRRR